MTLKSEIAASVATYGLMSWASAVAIGLAAQIGHLPEWLEVWGVAHWILGLPVMVGLVLARALLRRALAALPGGRP